MSKSKRLIQKLVAAAAVSAKFLERFVRPGTMTEPGRATTLLVMQHMLPLGNCVHMTPVYEALRKERPGLTIVVATRGLNLDVLRHSPFVDHLLETPDPLVDLPGAIRSLKEQLRTRGLRPDGCVTGLSDQRTRIALLAFASGAGWRGGYTVLDSLYHHPLSNDRGQSLIANNLRLARLAGAEAGLLEPRIFFSQQDAEAAQRLLAPLRGPNHRPVLVAVTQNSGGQATGWHTDRWVKVLQHAHAVLGYEVAFVGTAKEAEAINAIRQEAGSIGQSLAGQTSVTTLAAVLASSDMVVSLDTGTMHVGRTAGVPMVVLGPSWQRPLEWLPLGKEHVIILRGKDREDVPPGYKLDEVSAAAVIEALTQLAALYPADENARRARQEASLSTVDLLPKT